MFVKRLLPLLMIYTALFAYERTAFLMGTYVTVKTQKQNSELVQRAFEEVRSIEESLSTYKKNSLVYRLNEDKRVVADEYLKEILTLSKQMYEKSNGYFNVAVGSITKELYGFGEAERLPSDTQLQKANVSFLVRYGRNDQVSIPQNVKLDFGGIAKGYAVDRVGRLFEKEGVFFAVIALSGDIRCIGSCRVSVDSPWEKEGSIAVIQSDEPFLAVSTSGIYRRYVQQQRNNHIINPYTKHPQEEIVSLTLFGPFSNAYLDAMATAVTAMGLQKALVFLRHSELNYVLATRDRHLYVQRGRYKVSLTHPSVFVHMPYHADNDRYEHDAKHE